MYIAGPAMAFDLPVIKLSLPAFLLNQPQSHTSSNSEVSQAPVPPAGPSFHTGGLQKVQQFVPVSRLPVQDFRYTIITRAGAFLS